MALTWNWSEPCGFTYMKGIDDLYHYIQLWKGNAELIGMYPKREGSEIGWQLTFFFCDLTHMKNCLGLSRNTKNIFERDSFNNFVLFYDRCNAYKITENLQKAFPDLHVIITKSKALNPEEEIERSWNK